MKEEKSVTKLSHCLSLDNRKKLKLSGITDVESFDDQSVVAYTDLGELTVRGKDLHIGKLSLETGSLEIEGTISSVSYSDNQKVSGGGIFSKLFR